MGLIKLKIKTKQNFKTTLRYSLVKFKTHRTKKILKPFEEGKHRKAGHYKRMRITLASMDIRRSWNNLFRVLKIVNSESHI